MSLRNTIQRAWQELEPLLAKQGFELVEVELGGHGSRTVLRLFVDRNRGVTLDDCALVSQLVGPVLDLRDWIAGSYTLEVSSPGIDRPVRKPRDFERFAGERIAVQTVTPIEGRRQFTGALEGHRAGFVAVNCDGARFDIALENIKRAHLIR
jgi:ribosome maturation factor RimP